MPCISITLNFFPGILGIGDQAKAAGVIIWDLGTRTFQNQALGIVLWFIDSAHRGKIIVLMADNGIHLGLVKTP